MGYQLTRPDVDQLRFTSSKTGEWVLEDYLEAAELGNRTMASLLLDLFTASGTLRTLATPAEVTAAISSAANAAASAAAAQVLLTATQAAARHATPAFYGFNLANNGTELSHSYSVVTDNAVVDTSNFNAADFTAWFIGEGYTFSIINNNLVATLA